MGSKNVKSRLLNVCIPRVNCLPPSPCEPSLGPALTGRLRVEVGGPLTCPSPSPGLAAFDGTASTSSTVRSLTDPWRLLSQRPPIPSPEACDTHTLLLMVTCSCNHPAIMHRGFFRASWAGLLYPWVSCPWSYGRCSLGFPGGLQVGPFACRKNKSDKRGLNLVLLLWPSNYGVLRLLRASLRTQQQWLPRSRELTFQ